MLKRLVVRSLPLVGLLLACFLHLVLKGWTATEVVAGNLSPPILSEGRDLDAWRSSVSPGHVYDLSFAPVREPATGTAVPPGPDARLEIQLASNGRTRLVVARRGHPNTGVSWAGVLFGRERLQIVADRGWIDLGPVPPATDRFDVQILGLLPGPFGFTVPHKAQRAHFSAFRIRRPDSPLARPTAAIVRYRFVTARPVAAAETLARFFFFVSASRVLQATDLGALALLFAGWYWLVGRRVARAIACLVPALTLLHACCLAPFQGADEATHAGTVEAVVWNPAMFARPFTYPKSLALLYDAIGYQRWVRYPDLPVSIESPEERARVREVAGRRLEEEAVQAGPSLPDAILIDPRTRAPLYYEAFRIPGPLLRRMSVLERLEAYVVLSACASLALFLAGLFVLVRSRLTDSLVLLYGLVALVPYSVGVVASCSNYSPAIGLGALLAACALAAILAEDARWRARRALAFTLVSIVGIGVWDDFVFLAGPALVLLVALGVASAWRMPPGRARAFSTGLVAAAGALLAGLVGWSVVTGRYRAVFSSLGARLPRQLGGFEDPTLWLLLAVAATPFVVSLLLALFLERGRDLSEAARLRWAWARTAIGGALLVGLFAATPYTRVLFENTRGDLFDEIAAHASSFFSNNFSWDQDVLSWKMYWGVFGYADVSYPAVLYALARWTCVALFVFLPVLSVRFMKGRPRASALLLLVSGYAVSVCILTNGIRFLVPTNPWGRFILPLLPIAALTALARTEAPGRERWWRAAAVAAVALHVWTAITLLGGRYAVGN